MNRQKQDKKSNKKLQAQSQGMKTVKVVKFKSADRYLEELARNSKEKKALGSKTLCKALFASAYEALGMQTNQPLWAVDIFFVVLFDEERKFEMFFVW